MRVRVRRVGSVPELCLLLCMRVWVHVRVRALARARARVRVHVLVHVLVRVVTATSIKRLHQIESFLSQRRGCLCCDGSNCV